MGQQKSLIHFYAVISGYSKPVKDINKYIPPDITFAKREYYTPAVFRYVTGYLEIRFPITVLSLRRLTGCLLLGEFLLFNDSCPISLSML